MKLRVVTPDGRHLEREAAGDELVVGRSSRTGLSIPDRAMSREHARFFRRGEAWFVEDLGSHNGTRVNERLVTVPWPLAPGDRVGAGESVITVQLEAAAAAPPRRSSPADSSSASFRSAAEILSGALSAPAAIVESGDGRRAVERLRILNEVHHALGTSLAIEELLELILDRVFRHLQPQEGAIYLRGPDGTDFCAARRSATPHADTVIRSQHLLHEVVDQGRAARILDTASDERFAAAQSLVAAGVRSLIAAPLLDAEGALGMIVLGATIAVREFTDDDLELLVSLASVAAMRIRNVRLVAEALERQKLEQEVRLARQIQVTLLPAALPELPGYALHGGNLPSRGVSGDFYKVVRRAGDECAFLVADVSGKGVAASLLTASLEALSALPLEGDAPPDEVCGRVSRLLHQRTPPEKYATAFLALLSPATGAIRWVNAGHNAALLLKADGTHEWLKSSGPPLGLLPMAPFAARESRLHPGDALVLYTDGLTEAANREDEEFGADRLLAVCRGARDGSPQEMARALDAALEGFVQGVPYADDRTLLVVKREARA